VRGSAEEVDSCLARDAAHLNGMLAPGLSFSVEMNEASAVFALEERSGSRRKATRRRLRLTPGRRTRQLVLCDCLAECAMELGLGASVCRRGTGESP
jgi:hypothetical protein